MNSKFFREHFGWWENSGSLCGVLRWALPRGLTALFFCTLPAPLLELFHRTCALAAPPAVSFPWKEDLQSAVWFVLSRNIYLSDVTHAWNCIHIQLMLNIVFLGRVSSMASAPTSKYNSHSLENESIKRVSWIFRFKCLSLHFSFCIWILGSCLGFLELLISFFIHIMLIL